MIGSDLTLGHHAANFGDFRHCGSVDKTFLICHVISKDHVFKRLRVLWVEVPYSKPLPCHVY